MDTEKILESIGLNKQESKVYLAALKLGISKASEIAKKAEINREASYYTLKLLQQKGYISEFLKSGVKYYSAAAPKRILEIINEERDEKKRLIGEVLLELELLHKTAITQPKVEFYQGLNGLKTAMMKLLECKNEEVYSYVPEKIFSLTSETFSEQFRRRRRENKIKLKVITEKTNFMMNIKKRDKEEMREMRFNKIVDKTDALYYITKDALIIIKANEKDQLGIYIKEESTALMQRRIFESIWKESEK